MVGEPPARSTLFSDEAGVVEHLGWSLWQLTTPSPVSRLSEGVENAVPALHNIESGSFALQGVVDGSGATDPTSRSSLPPPPSVVESPCAPFPPLFWCRA